MRDNIHCNFQKLIYVEIVCVLGDLSDEKYHVQVHSVLIEKLKMPQWKTERVVGQFPVGYVICVKPGDHGSLWNKVKEGGTVSCGQGFGPFGSGNQIRWPEYICILPTKSCWLPLSFIYDFTHQT